MTDRRVGASRCFGLMQKVRRIVAEEAAGAEPARDARRAAAGAPKYQILMRLVDFVGTIA